MIEDYCSFEVAKLLKEKGFNEPLRLVIHSSGEIKNVGLDEINANLLWTTKCCSCVSHQMAMKWLREKHNIVIGINVGNEFNKGNTDYSNPDRWWYFWEFTDIRGVYKEELQPNALSNEYCTYEEAVEAALKYCLTNLIANG